MLSRQECPLVETSVSPLVFMLHGWHWGKEEILWGCFLHSIVEKWNSLMKGFHISESEERTFPCFQLLATINWKLIPQHSLSGACPSHKP
jgi:hypothetical protein